ncbi:hypothetical protein, partial [Clavibacter michiganensis]|uniref:hypothetical protein n=1 Tax=Clavibacter michiganensis TaxID=28447 RepID=UPI001F2F066A
RALPPGRGRVCVKKSFLLKNFEETHWLQMTASPFESLETFPRPMGPGKLMRAHSANLAYLMLT